MGLTVIVAMGAWAGATYLAARYEGHWAGLLTGIGLFLLLRWLLERCVGAD